MLRIVVLLLSGTQIDNKFLAGNHSVFFIREELSLIGNGRISDTIGFDGPNQSDNNLLACSFGPRVVYIALSLELLICQIEVPLKFHSDSVDPSGAQPEALAFTSHIAAVRNLLLFHLNKVHSGVEGLLGDKEPLPAFKSVFVAADWHDLRNHIVFGR